MRKLLFILLACLPAVLKAQAIKEPAPAVPTEPLYLIDGTESSKVGMSSLNPDDILRVEILKDDVSAKAIYGIRGAQGVVLITTEPYAVKHYRELLGSFSKDLQNWLTANDTTKAQLRYFIDGEEISEHTGTGKGRLYDLTKEHIKSVSFIRDEPQDSKYAAKVKIETKK